MDGTARRVSVTVNAYKDGIKAPGNCVVVLVLEGQVDVDLPGVLLVELVGELGQGVAVRAAR